MFSSSEKKKSKSSKGEGNDEDLTEYLEYVQEAERTDLSDIEQGGCVSMGTDLQGNPVIVFVPALGLNRSQPSEVIFHRMLLLFLAKTHRLITAPYSVVYAHTSIDLMNQYPLIYKFYSILPRAYKKNLQKMYVIHPNVGIRMFFEFARVFLSHKFYSKLALFDTILEFQRVVPPTILALPSKFLRKEDEELELKYCGVLPPLSVSYDPVIGTTRALDACATMLKARGALIQEGIFRVSGDDAELTMAKVRLQYAYQSLTSSSPKNRGSAQEMSSRIAVSEKNDSLLIGDLELLYATPVVNTKESSSNNKRSSSKKMSSNGSSKVQTSDDSGLLPEPNLPILVMRDINTVAQIFKLCIRDLSCGLIPADASDNLVSISERYLNLSNSASGNQQLQMDTILEWEMKISEVLSNLPVEHLSTLAFVVDFLQEVANLVDLNCMAASNLAVVFAPTVFRVNLNDPGRAPVQIRMTQLLMQRLIESEKILRIAVQMFVAREAANSRATAAHEGGAGVGGALLSGWNHGDVNEPEGNELLMRNRTFRLMLEKSRRESLSASFSPSSPMNEAVDIEALVEGMGNVMRSRMASSRNFVYDASTEESDGTQSSSNSPVSIPPKSELSVGITEDDESAFADCADGGSSNITPASVSSYTSSFSSRAQPPIPETANFSQRSLPPIVPPTPATANLEAEEQFSEAIEDVSS